MADVTVRPGFQNRYQIAGINAAGNAAPLDPNTALILEQSAGAGQLLQSAAALDQVVIKAGPDRDVSQFKITADGDPSAGVAPISIDVTSTTTRTATDDATVVGMTLLGEEADSTPV